MKKLDVHDFERMCALKFDDEDLVTLTEELNTFITTFDETVGKMDLDTLYINPCSNPQYISIEESENDCLGNNIQDLQNSLNLNEDNYIVVTNKDKLESD